MGAKRWLFLAIVPVLAITYWVCESESKDVTVMTIRGAGPQSSAPLRPWIKK